MTSVLETLSALDRQVRALTAADSVSDVFRTLLESSRIVAPRSAVYLVRQGNVQGWGSLGYPREVAARIRGYVAPVGQGWLGELARQTETAVERRPGTVSDPALGQPPSEDTVGCAVRVKGKPIAILCAERGIDEQPWAPEALQVLVTVAQLRLELDLAMRKLAGIADRAAATAAVPAAAPSPNVSPVAAAPPPAPVAIPLTPTHRTAAVRVAPESTEIELATESPAADPQLEAARRYARLVATDIRLYNEEAVALGRQNGDLLDRLSDQLGRGKETFLRRHADLGPTALEILRDAYVQVLAAGDPQLIPESFAR